MNNEQAVQTLQGAFSSYVEKRFHELCDALSGGADRDDAHAEFAKHVQTAQEAYANAAPAMTGTGPMESDDDFRARMLPIAGDDAHRQQIINASGAALDTVGMHYNLSRAAVAAPTETPRQPTGVPSNAVDPDTVDPVESTQSDAVMARGDERDAAEARPEAASEDRANAERVAGAEQETFGRSPEGAAPQQDHSGA